MAVVIAGALALAGCGGDDDDAGDGSSDVADNPVDNEAVGDAEACALVTEEDATGLFGEEARPAEDVSPADLGSSCLWDTEFHLLQVRVYDGEQFYAAETLTDAEEIDIAERAYVSNAVGVDVGFVKDGQTVNLNYTVIGIGNDLPDASTQQDEVIELARQAADRL